MNNNIANGTTDSGLERNLNLNGCRTGYDESLEMIACDLTDLARQIRPDNSLSGILAGYEADIRQEAVLMALEWYQRPQDPNLSPPKSNWNARQAIFGALRIQMKRYYSMLRRHTKVLQGYSNHRRITEATESTSHHPASSRPCTEWPAPALRAMIGLAINNALESGRITMASSRIAIGVLVDQIPVATLAKSLDVTPSAVYQHLAKVRIEIPHIIDGLEVSFEKFLK